MSTWVVFHRNWFPEFAADVPYAAVQVELDEGPRITSNLVGVANEDIRMGMAVEVVFDDGTPDVTLPRFRPISCHQSLAATVGLEGMPARAANTRHMNMLICIIHHAIHMA